MPDPFERLLARNARRAGTVGACPDAETLAAFVDRGLPATDRERVAAHVADCPRCAQHVAALVRFEDILPGEAAQVAPARPVWLRWRWMVPVATAALVAVIWTSLPRERARPPQATQVRVRPEIESPDKEADEMREARPAERRLDQPLAKTAPAGSAARSSRKAEVAQQQHVLRSGSMAASHPIVPAPAPAVPPASDIGSFADARSAAEPPPTAEAPASPAAQAADNLKVKPQEHARNGVFRQKRDEAGLAANSAVTEHVTVLTPDLLVSAPDPTIQWRVIGGRIERTTDAGATWQAERAPRLGDPLGGSAPAAEICWIVSRSGTVVRRSASGAWTVTHLPSGVSPSSIAAHSALEATVTARDGRQWHTVDGGDTWNPSKPR
jgi:hypothetical protein